MKRLSLCLFSMLLAAAPVLAANAPAKPAPKPSPKASGTPAAKRVDRTVDMAPADRYFGRMKMSFLGINNTFRDMTVSAGPSTVDPNITNKLDLADDALSDWAKKFPREPQLARSYYLEEIAFKKVWIKSYQDRAWSIMKMIAQRYPNSFFAKQVRNDIKAGFTAHYYATPSACVAPPLPTPTPTLAPTPEPTPTPGRGRKAAAPSPSPLPSESPALVYTPEPAATPVPGPTTTSDPQGFKVSIEPVPCEEKWTAVSTTATSITGDVLFSESAITLSGTRIPITSFGTAPAAASYMPLADGPPVRLYRILIGRDVVLKSGNKLCSAVPTYLTVRRAPATNAYDIFLSVYKGDSAPTGASGDALCSGFTYSYPVAP